MKNKAATAFPSANTKPSGLRDGGVDQGDRFLSEYVDVYVGEVDWAQEFAFLGKHNSRRQATLVSICVGNKQSDIHCRDDCAESGPHLEVVTSFQHAVPENSARLS